MTWPELFKTKFIMRVCSNYLTLWHKLTQLCDSRKEHLLIGPFEILVLFSVQESYEVRDRGDSECLAAVSCYLCINGDEDQVWVIVGLCGGFESGLNAHTWRAGRAPEIYYQSRSLFY